LQYIVSPLQYFPCLYFPLISNRQLIYNIIGCLFSAGNWFLLDKAFNILIALIIGQVLIVKYLRNDFDKRDEIMREAGNFTTNLQVMMEMMRGKKAWKMAGYRIIKYNREKMLNK